VSVLIEALCVVLKASAVAGKYPGGWEAFARAAPPGTLCADGELVRVGFMRPQDVQDFIAALSRHGFVHLRDGKARDLVVVDQTGGLRTPCDWAEFARVAWAGDPSRKVAVCRRPGSTLEQVLTPEGWKFESSLSTPGEIVIG
jgi:hypothetical protein